MDDLDKEVKDEASGKGEGTKTSTNSEGKEVASTTSTGDGKTKPTTTKSTPKTKLIMKRVPIKKNVRGGGSIITGYRNVDITVNAVTGKEISRRTVKSMPKNTDVSGLKKETTGAKVVIVDVPIPSNKTSTQQNTTQIPINQGDSDGVNSKKAMLAAIDS